MEIPDTRQNTLTFTQLDVYNNDLRYISLNLSYMI